MALDTIGSIANFIASSFTELPSGISGNTLLIVDMARQHVSNYVGIDIGSNSISAAYAPAIIDFAKADIIDMAVAQGDDRNMSLGEMSIGGNSLSTSAESFRVLGETKLKALGQKRRFARSLS